MWENQEIYRNIVSNVEIFMIFLKNHAIFLVNLDKPRGIRHCSSLLGCHKTDQFCVDIIPRNKISHIVNWKKNNEMNPAI